jgi:transposase-like protein
MIQRRGAVIVRMLENVQQATIRSLIERFIAPGTCVYTDCRNGALTIRLCIIK